MNSAFTPRYARSAYSRRLQSVNARRKVAFGRPRRAPGRARTSGLGDGEREGIPEMLAPRLAPPGDARLHGMASLDSESAKSTGTNPGITEARQSPKRERTKRLGTTSHGLATRDNGDMMNVSKTGRVAELADARDLKSRGRLLPCGFESRLGYLFYRGYLPY